MNAVEQTQKIINKFGTLNVYEIAEKSGVKIIYQRWYPTTAGEFDKKNKTICVNTEAVLANLVSEQEIIAHELGHFFAEEFGFDRKSEENFAKEFANALINLK